MSVSRKVTETSYFLSEAPINSLLENEGKTHSSLALPLDVRFVA
jgi:hypothetical protein